MSLIRDRSDLIECLEIIALLLVVVFSLSYLGLAYGYRYNTSHSYPSGLYRLDLLSRDYAKGDLVLFCPPNNAAINLAISRGYLDEGRCESGSVPVIKRIAATEFDSVTLDKMIVINGKTLPNTTILKADSQHRPLVPYKLKEKGSFTVPANTVFLYSDYAPRKSFDSRYFGIVAIKDIKGKIKSVEW